MSVGDVVVATQGLDGLTQGNTYVVVDHSDRMEILYGDLVLDLHVSVINDRGEVSMYQYHTFKLLSEIRDYRLSKVLGK